MLVYLLFFSLSLLILKLTHAILWVPYRIQSHFNKQGIHGPPYYPLFGNTAEIRRMYADAQSEPLPMSSPSTSHLVHDHDHDIARRVMPFYTNWAARYGKNFLYWFGSRPMVAVAEPNMVKEVLMNSSGGFAKIKHNPIAKLLFMDGLVGLEGHKWALHRRIANQAFSIDNVKGWIPDMVCCTVKMLDQLEEKMADHEDEVEIEMNQELHKLMADIISRTAFGSSYEEGQRIFELQDQQVKLFSLAVRSIYIPGFRFLPTWRNRERWRLDRETRNLIQGLITKSCEMKEQRSRNLMSLLLSPYTSNEDGKEERLGINEVIAECKTFYFAGKETTANLLSWVLFLLGLNQEWQTRAREEVIHLCGNPPCFDNINELKIVSMIINETLRLYPPAVMLKRRTTKQVNLGGHLSLPAETQLYLPMTAIHHDVNLWGEDAHHFNPARFDSAAADSTTKPAAAAMGSFFPFSLGPRLCVGQNFAMVESKVVLALFLTRYSFTLSPTYVHAPMQLATLQPQYGLQLVLRKISNNSSYS